MRNLKLISIFATCGFVLSFVFGLFSHSSFGIILLRALIVGVIFTALGFLISYIFNKFLSDSDSIVFDGEDVGDSVAKSKKEGQKPGQIIDVVVEDEELPKSESDNHFVVGSTAQMLKRTDIGEVNNNGKAENNNNGFVPMKGFENVSSSATESAGSANNGTVGNIIKTDNGDNKNETANVTGQTVSDEELDTLPDMESLDLSGEEEPEEDNNSMSDSDFVSSKNMYKKSGSSGPDIKDAALIAKAISTALSEEN